MHKYFESTECDFLDNTTKLFQTAMLFRLWDKESLQTLKNTCTNFLSVKNPDMLLCKRLI